MIWVQILLQFLASSILNTNSLRAVVAGFRVNAADADTDQEILNLISDEYEVRNLDREMYVCTYVCTH